MGGGRSGDIDGAGTKADGGDQCAETAESFKETEELRRWAYSAAILRQREMQKALKIQKAQSLGDKPKLWAAEVIVNLTETKFWQTAAKVRNVGGEGCGDNKSPSPL